jgi:hypothetical protein
VCWYLVDQENLLFGALESMNYLTFKKKSCYMKKHGLFEKKTDTY